MRCWLVAAALADCVGPWPSAAATCSSERIVMEYITLPGTGLKVSRVCLGTMQFSNSWEWPCDQATATAVVNAAISAGINFFDTAQAYQVDGDRCSERMLGVALGERRSGVVIASKFGLHVGEDQTVCDGRAVTQAIDDTLAALGTDYLDLMQIHWPGNMGYIGERSHWLDAKDIVAALESAVAQGKLKYYGCCNFGTEDLKAFEAAGGKPVSNQLPYNLLFRPIESGILPACIDRNMGVLTYSSLQQALLTGRFTDASTVPEGRRRTRLFAGDSTPKSRHGGPGVEPELFGAIAGLRQVADSTNGAFSMADLAVGWLLAQPGVSCLLIGASTVSHSRHCFVGSAHRVHSCTTLRVSSWSSQIPIILLPACRCMPACLLPASFGMGIPPGAQ